MISHENSTTVTCDPAGRHGSALLASPRSAVRLAPVARPVDATGLSVARPRPAAARSQAAGWQPATASARAGAIGGLRAVGDVDTFRGTGRTSGLGFGAVAVMKHNSIARSGPPRGRHR